MTEEVDLRLLALGLVPAPGTATEPAKPPDWETAAPPPPPVAPAPPALGVSGPKPRTAGDLCPGMGKFTGMPSGVAPPAAPPPPPGPFVAPAPPVWSPLPPAPAPEAPAAPEQTSAYMPPAYTAPVVAPPPPQIPTREAPPPLPRFAAAMPAATAVAEAPVAVPGKREKPRKEKKERAEKVAKPSKAKVERAPKPAKLEKAKAPPKPRYQLAPSGVLLRGPVVMGYPEQKLQITLEQLGFRINAKESIEVPWSDVKDIKARRGRVMVRTKGRAVSFGIPIEGIAEPTLAGPLARVVKEASAGSLDLAGSSFLELQNATDSLRDHYHDEDDPLIPTVVGLVFVLAGLTVSALLPDILAIATRTPVGPGAYLVDSPLALIDPRILAASFAAGAMLAAGVVRVAMGKGATAWARGTLRGWHGGGRRIVDLASRGLAAIVLSPALAAALLLGSIVLSLPSTRVQTVIDQSGFHLMSAVPFFDDDRAWSTVTKIDTVPAPTQQHFEGIAVVFTFNNRSPVSTLDGHLRGGTDKQLFDAANKWWEDAR